jgi:endonuclease YncB( thermonuclease family)
MGSKKQKLYISFALFFLFLISPFTHYAQLVGKVISISDGDSFIMSVESREIKISLHGIDCPEKSQDFGEAAHQFLADLIYNEIVSVEEINVDRYGYVHGIVTADQINVNESLLRAGLAWHYKVNNKNRVWAGLENKARKEKIGLWENPHPLEPWKWRKMDKRRMDDFDEG